MAPRKNWKSNQLKHRSRYTTFSYLLFNIAQKNLKGMDTFCNTVGSGAVEWERGREGENETEGEGVERLQCHQDFVCSKIPTGKR